MNNLRPLTGSGRKLYIETYGCQMNVGDSEIVVSIMQQEGYRYTEVLEEADIVLINTCSIRDNAEQRIWGRLSEMRRLKKQKPSLVVGIVGCMAERLNDKLLEEGTGVDIVAGPDAYRDLPKLLKEAESGQKGVNVLLSMEETYAEIAPVRIDKNGVSAFIAHIHLAAVGLNEELATLAGQRAELIIYVQSQFLIFNSKFFIFYSAWMTSSSGKALKPSP